MIGFLMLCEYLEAHASFQHDMQHLMQKLYELSPRGCYCEKSLRTKLLEKYGGKITFSNVHKEKTVVTFSDLAVDILSSSHKEQQRDKLKQDLDRAANHILQEMKKNSFPRDMYPTLMDMEEGEENTYRIHCFTFLRRF